MANKRKGSFVEAMKKLNTIRELIKEAKALPDMATIEKELKFLEKPKVCFTGQRLTHNTFGVGKIIADENGYWLVSFKDKVRKLDPGTVLSKGLVCTSNSADEEALAAWFEEAARLQKLRIHILALQLDIAKGGDLEDKIAELDKLEQELSMADEAIGA